MISIIAGDSILASRGAKLDQPAKQGLSEGANVNSTLKIQKSEALTLIEQIKAEIKKRSEAKAKRMLLKRPKRLAKRFG